MRPILAEMSLGMPWIIKTVGTCWDNVVVELDDTEVFIQEVEDR